MFREIFKNEEAGFSSHHEIQVYMTKHFRGALAEAETANTLAPSPPKQAFVALMDLNGG